MTNEGKQQEDESKTSKLNVSSDSPFNLNRALKPGSRDPEAFEKQEVRIKQSVIQAQAKRVRGQE